MAATFSPERASATATCMAAVVLPEPPFSFPNTMICARELTVFPVDPLGSSRRIAVYHP